MLMPPANLPWVNGRTCILQTFAGCDMKPSEVINLYQVCELLKKRIASGKLRKEGICAGLEEVIDDCTSRLGRPDRELFAKWYTNKYDAFMAWEHFSGSRTYPVPVCMLIKDGYSASNRFDDAHTAGKMWHKGTGYGRLRHKLLDHLIEYFKERDI
jgi:hypothetical protein